MEDTQANTGDATGILHIALANWVVQDGNYPDLVVGQVLDFVVEFHETVPLQPCPDGKPKLLRLKDSEYEIVGRVLSFDGDGCPVLDAGISMLPYCGSALVHAAAPGDWISGRVSLELGTCICGRDPNDPTDGSSSPPTYQATIDSIQRIDKSTDRSGGERHDQPLATDDSVFANAVGQFIRTSIERTDAWNETGHYLLSVTLSRGLGWSDRNPNAHGPSPASLPTPPTPRRPVT
jgi:hypothetical protein